MARVSSLPPAVGGGQAVIRVQQNGLCGTVEAVIIVRYLHAVIVHRDLLQHPLAARTVVRAVGIGGPVCTCPLRVVYRAAGHLAGRAAVGIVMSLPAGPGERRNAAGLIILVTPVNSLRKVLQQADLAVRSVIILVNVSSIITQFAEPAKGIVGGCERLAVAVGGTGQISVIRAVSVRDQALASHLDAGLRAEVIVLEAVGNVAA